MNQVLGMQTKGAHCLLHALQCNGRGRQTEKNNILSGTKAGSRGRDWVPAVHWVHRVALSGCRCRFKKGQSFGVAALLLKCYEMSTWKC